MNQKIGYDVTTIRAAELIMYTCGVKELPPHPECFPPNR
jgi:hypothetical protein